MGIKIISICILLLAINAGCRKETPEYGTKYSVKGALINGTSMKPIPGFHLGILYKFSIYTGNNGAYGKEEMMSECVTDSLGRFELYYYDRIRFDYTSSVYIVGDSDFQYDLGLNFRFFENIENKQLYISDSASYAFFGQPDYLKEGNKLVFEFQNNQDTIFDTITNLTNKLTFFKRIGKKELPRYLIISLYKNNNLQGRSNYSDYYHQLDPDTNKIFFPY